jgi:hypothetical protein
LTWRGLISNLGQFYFVFLLLLFCLENHVYLSHGVQVAGAAWYVATWIMAGVGDLVQRIEDGRTGPVFGGRAIERSGGTVSAPYTWRRGVRVSLLSLKIKVDGLCVLCPQNHSDGFASKPVVTV